MPYEKSDFQAAEQAKYKTAVANAAGTSAPNVDIVSITEAQRRAGGIKIETRIRSVDAAGVTKITTSLGTGDALKTKIDSELAKQGLRESTAVSSPVSTSPGKSSAGGMIAGATVGTMVLVGLVALAVYCLRKTVSKASQVSDSGNVNDNSRLDASDDVESAPVYSSAPVHEGAMGVATSADIVEESTDVEDLGGIATSEDIDDMTFDRLAADGRDLTSEDLNLPAAAQAIGSVVFNDTFFDGGQALVDGILSAGQHVPCIGAIFSILKDLKESVQTHAEAEEECGRLSTWCVSMIASIGYLGREAAIDAETNDLIRTAIPPLMDLKKLVVSRRDHSRGYLNRMVNFWTDAEYLRKSDLAQTRVKSAIDALSLRVQVQTKVDVQKMLSQCEMLPNMDKKLDVLVSMAEESSKKLDQVLEFASQHAPMAEESNKKLGQVLDLAAQQAQLAAKRSVKEKVAERKVSNMDKYNISSASCKKEDEPFARGTTASVYRARWDRQLVAVKVVALLGVPRAERDKIHSNFMAEVDILVRLRHPNILSVFGLIDDDVTCLQLVMAFASLGELGVYLRQSTDSLPLDQQLEFCSQIASGLRYLHSQNVAHRDLKSLNILITKNTDGEMLLLISDFGLSREEIGATMATALALGTPAWSAPEILEQTPNPDYFQSDIYSFGVVVWEVVTRSIPFEGFSFMQLMRAVGVQGMKMTLSVDFNHHQTLVDIVDGCCATVPADRFCLRVAWMLFSAFDLFPVTSVATKLTPLWRFQANP